MTHTVMRHVRGRRAGRAVGRRSITATLAAAALVGALAVALPGLTSTAAQAAKPTGPTDPSKVPHYFGPWPNWALSQLTTPTAAVEITGSGTGATASANVDPLTGGIATIDVTNAGSGYTGGATVTINGGDPGNAATATATVTTSGSVTGYTVGTAGSGYRSFDVTLTGGAGTGATAQGSGGVDPITITDGGRDYVMPVVEFDMPDLANGVQAKGHVPMIANNDPIDGMDANGTITAVVIDEPGSGYLTAPGVAIHNGTIADPLAGATPAVVSTTLHLTAIDPVDFGSGYTSAPDVAVADGDQTGTPGAGATATSATDIGAVTAITVDTPGAGYLAVGIRKFQDALPVTCSPAAPGGCPSVASGEKFIPLGVPAAKTYSGEEADEYVIGLVQYRTKFHTDIDPTLVRGYVQIETPENAAVSQHVELTNELLDGTKVPVLDKNGNQVFGVTAPQWLGPFIGATKNRPTRIVFHNYLPTGAKGDLFLPVDSTMMGSGMGPMDMGTPVTDDSTVMDAVRNPECTQEPKDGMHCFTDNRAELHLHGGTTPWISDGTPHQWVTPAGENAAWPQGVAVSNVPDMVDPADNSVVCDKADDGCQTFYYTNQQSARLMFYHDHSWGITRLNVYAGEAAGYVITDETEQALVNSGTIPGANDTLPLVVQDRTFTPDAAQLALQDPTWDETRWGTKGSFWYHHVYMPAQNPGDPSGMSAYGRWMYGPWFWPPATGTKYGPIKNPYYTPDCKLDDPGTWTYDTDPFCEPELIPGTPNISAGMEQFNDTPIVNGVAYPTVTLQPKSYRMRILNAANDRFFNLQWYTADPNQGDGTTEVRLNAAELAAAQTDPNISPTPADANNNAAGPDWVQIGSEGGFLPKPAVIDGQQPTTWITDPTRFDVGNVDLHSMLLAPAERSDAIVDFSKFAGKTLILYNDAPAAFPARVPSYDYYTGAPDMSPNGAPKILPGYGPNTRTVMQVKIAATTPAPAFNLTKLTSAFKHKANGSGVFESGQHPVIVGQAAYNSAYGTAFATGSNCNGASTSTTCDGLVRVNDTGSFSFNTLKAPTSKMTIGLEPKAIHDEMNSSTFDPFGRMQANLGIEAQPPTPGAQNVTLYPYTNPTTEIIDGTNLESAGAKATPISSAADGTQIWRITHNGVDTHPIHFHLFDVQVLNRVTWDNIVIPPDENELGWKDTVRMSPLEDTIVALRPLVPKTPFEVPNSVRPLDPMMPLGSPDGFNNMDVQGNPTAAITNQLVNFGWEYVFHCHILSHEEMDMMRPVDLALPPAKAGALWTEKAPDGGTNRWIVHWDDNSITETAFTVERSTDDGATWSAVGTVASPLDAANIHQTRSMADPGSTADVGTTQYRVVAKNTVGYGNGFPTKTVQSVSAAYTAVDTPAPATATALTGVIAAGPSVDLAWTDGGNVPAAATAFQVQRTLTGSAAWTTIGTTPAATTTYTDSTVSQGSSYDYRVVALNGGRAGAPSNVVTVALVVPTAPSTLTASLVAGPGAALAWTNTATNATGVVVQRSTNGGGTWTTLATLPATDQTYTDAGPLTVDSTDLYRVYAENLVGPSPVSNTASVSAAAPGAPTNVAAKAQAGVGGPEVKVTWTDNATDETGYTVQRSTDGGGSWTTLASLGADAVQAIDPGPVVAGTTYTYRVGVTNLVTTVWSANVSVTPALAAAPSGLAATLVAATATRDASVNLVWTDNATDEDSTVVQRSTDGGTSWTTLTTFAGATGTGAQATIDLAPLPGATNTYRVGAVSFLGTSLSGTASVTLVTPPAAPGGFGTQVRTGPLSVRSVWTDASTNESGFSLQRSTDGGVTWTQLSTRPAAAGTGTALNRTDTAVTLGSTYSYRVVAWNAGGRAATAVQTVTVAAPPVPVVTTPAQATSTSATTESIALSWIAVPGAQDYRIERATSAAGAGRVSVTRPGTSYTFTNLTKRVWYVRVGARNGLGTTYSPWVAVAAAP